MEIWKDIEGYENYQVSNLGNVKSLNYGRTGIGKILKPRLTKGYYLVCLSKNGVMKNKYVHRLVIEAFTLNYDNKSEIDHIDAIPTNNHVNNLRWTTHKENMNNPLSKIKKSGDNCYLFRKLGALHHSSIPVLQYSKDGKFIKEYAGGREAQRATGIYQGHISSACKGKAKTAGGYIWKYKNN